MRESLIQKAILDYLAAEHIFAFRLNSAAFSGESNGKHRFFKAHSLGQGAADILAIIPEHYFRFGTQCKSLPQHALWIEVKTAKGKQSAEQRSFQAHVELFGHRYLLARSVDEVDDVIQALKL